MSWGSSGRLGRRKDRLGLASKSVLELLNVFFVDTLVWLLHVVEALELGIDARNQVNSARNLFDLFEPEFAWEDKKIFHRILSFVITPLELLHSLHVFGNAQNSLASVRLNLTSSSFKFHLSSSARNHNVVLK
jgi:hypothetical protein